MNDTIFAPYWRDIIIYQFEQHTGCVVSKSQQEELVKFLDNWVIKNFEESKKD